MVMKEACWTPSFYITEVLRISDAQTQEDAIMPRLQEACSICSHSPSTSASKHIDEVVANAHVEDLLVWHVRQAQLRDGQHARDGSQPGRLHCCAAASFQGQLDGARACATGPPPFALSRHS